MMIYRDVNERRGNQETLDEDIGSMQCRQCKNLAKSLSAIANQTQWTEFGKEAVPHMYCGNTEAVALPLVVKIRMKPPSNQILKKPVKSQ